MDIGKIIEADDPGLATAMRRVVTAVASGSQVDTAELLTILPRLAEYIDDNMGTIEIDWDRDQYFSVDRRSWQWSDEELRADMDLGADEDITDALRVQWARQRFESDCKSNMDADCDPLFLPCTWESSPGIPVVVGASLLGYSFSGVSVTVHGLFRTQDDLERWRQTNGYVRSAEDLTDDMILERWQASDE